MQAKGDGRRARGLADILLTAGCVFVAVASAGARGEGVDGARAAEHLAEAIRFRTLSVQGAARGSEASDGGEQRAEAASLRDDASFEAFRRFLRRTYPGVFRALRVETISRHSLLLEWEGSNTALRPVLFEAHYDVVPVEEGTLTDWEHPPFDGVIADGYVWGRGAIDDKCGVITFFEALEALLAEGHSPQRSLVFAIGHDEEIGGFQGAKIIAERLRASGREFEYVIGEGGGLVASYPLVPSRTIAMIGLAQKSYLTLHLSLEGEGGHSSMPRGASALVRLAEGVARLQAQPFEAQLASPVTDMLRALGPYVGGAAGLAMRYPLLTQPLLLGQLEGDPAAAAMVRTTTAVTMFTAGVKENVVPQRARAVVNFRLMPWDTVEAVEARVREIVGLPGLEIRSDYWGASPPVADPEAAGYRKITASIAAVDPEILPTPNLVVAVTDSRHFGGLAPNIYHFRPWTTEASELGSIHGTNERVAVAAVERAVEISRELLARASQAD